MNEQEYIFTGHRRIDIPTYGLKPGQLVAVGSKPSGGKTSFAIDCALHASGKQDIPTIYFCLVTARKYLERRIYPKCSSIPDKLFIDDSSVLSVESFKLKIKDAIAEHGVRLAIIDYVQLMRGPEELKGHRIQELTHIVCGLKECAETFGITILMLSEMGEFPFQGSYFRESPEIEKQSDVVIVIEDDIPNVKKRAEPRIPLREDGRLDIERINSLSHEEYMDVLGSLSEEQEEEYIKSIPPNESHEPVLPVKVDYTMEEAIEWGMMVDAETLLEEMRKKCGIKKEE